MLFIFLCFSFSSYGSECKESFSGGNNQSPSEPSLREAIKDLGLAVVHIIKKPSYFLDKTRAKNGDSIAQYKLSLRYYLGEGVKKDDEKAVYWAEKSANQGYPPSQHLLGRLFIAELNFEKAIYWLEKYAGIKGYREVKFELEDIDYRQSILDTMYRITGIKTNHQQIFSLLKQLAHQGNLPAQYLLAVMYHIGLGVKEDLVQAYKWSVLAKHNDQDIPESNLPLLYSNEKSELIKEIEMMVNDIADELTQNQIAEAQKLVDEFKPLKP